MLGANEDSGTRSSLLYQVVRLLREREREVAAAKCVTHGECRSFA